MIIKKARNTPAEQSLTSISDSYNDDLAIVRKDGCEILFMNAAANRRLDPELHSVTNCKRGYSNLFPGLCDKCPLKPDFDREASVFDVKDRNGRTFSVARHTVLWLDGKPATAFITRDVEEERSAQERMFRLAYYDPLTGMPNRQKLKEDFESIEKDIASGGICGILAIFDLDNFKAINDNYGHNTGDEMLKRITAHLNGDSSFKGRIYRLGGDEFVLFYKENPGRFEDQSAFRTYFQEILQKSLLAYTMPNIEDKCTLSMGVAFYPQHGDNMSELLRKADIALYKAKAEGRNKVMLFEDKYDASKKFKDLYINLQPILIKNGSTYGYELADSDSSVPEDDNTYTLNEFNRTLDALGLNDFSDKTRYFISYTKQLFDISVLKNLPKDKFVIQIQASDRCTAEKLQLYKQLRAFGYLLALSNVDNNNINRDLLAIAEFVKFAPEGITGSEQARIIAANPNKTFIASNVSTGEQFETATRRGFTLFQGYFFKTQVVIKKEKDVEPLKANYFRLLQLTSTDDYVDFNEISAVISSDVALSYKLLRLLNSASVGLRTRASSILMAVTYLGEENLKKWISVLALRGISNEKPLELVRMSLIRARFGEILAPGFNPPKDARHIFLTGLLSLLHIALDKTKEALLEEIPVAEEIRRSLLGNEGPYSELLEFFKDYEYSNWEGIHRFSEKYSLNSDAINDAYIKSVRWCNDLIDAY